MKRTVCGLLCMMLVLLSFSGCSASDEELLVGRWTVKADLGNAYETMLAEADPTMTGHIDIGEFKVDMALELRENGTFRWTLDQDQLKSGVKKLRDAIASGLGVPLQIETGMTVEEALRASGLTMDDVMDRFFEPDMAAMINETLGKEGVYTLKDNKLILTDQDKFVMYEGGYTVGENELKLTGGHADSLLSNLLPLTFKK